MIAKCYLFRSFSIVAQNYLLITKTVYSDLTYATPASNHIQKLIYFHPGYTSSSQNYPCSDPYRPVITRPKFSPTLALSARDRGTADSPRDLRFQPACLGAHRGPAVATPGGVARRHFLCLVAPWMHFAVAKNRQTGHAGWTRNGLTDPLSFLAAFVGSMSLLFH